MNKLLGENFNFAQFDCKKVETIEENCRNRFQIINYPTFILFKSIKLIKPKISFIDTNNQDNDWYEIYYSSKQSPQDITKFVKDNAYTTVRTLKSFDLSTANLELFQNEKLAYFVDFFAPW